jgi:hypothetical protein
MGIVYPEGADFVAILREWVHLTARSRFLALLGMTNKLGNDKSVVGMTSNRTTSLI